MAGKKGLTKQTGKLSVPTGGMKKATPKVPRMVHK